MSKEKLVKLSKFNGCYNELRSNEILRAELSELSGSKLKTRLIEIFPNVEITGHLLRKVRELLKDTTKTKLNTSTEIKNIDTIEKNITNETNTFEEISLDNENYPSENNADNSKEIAIVEDTEPHNNLEKEEFIDSNYNISLKSNNSLNKITGVITNKNNIEIIDKFNAEVNNLEKEIENKNSDIELLTSQLDSANEKIKSLSIVNDEKQKEILNIQNNYTDTSNHNCRSINLNHDMIRDLISAYINSKVINIDALVVNDIDIATYCVKKAIAESIFIYGIKS